MKFTHYAIATLMLALSLISFQASADDTNSQSFWNTDHCKNSKWTDANGNPISIEEKFGPGSMAVTRCLSETRQVKVLYQINQECKNAKCDAPYAVGNIVNHINDFEITHGMDSDDYEIVVIVHSAGWKLVLDNNAVEKHATNNPFQSAMEDLVARDNVKVLFCQNTANSKGVVFANMLQGVGFVTAGVSAISDLQEEGYGYIQP